MPEGPTSPAPSGDFETALSSDDGLDLRVWLRLLTCSTLIEREVRQRLREEFDITLPRFDLLAQLDRAPDGLTMGTLSSRLMVSNGNITGLIDRLVTEGLVERQPAPGDRRAQLVRLTPEGKDAFDRMTPAHAGWIHNLFAGLDRTELTALFDSLAKLKASLSRAEQE